MQCFNKDSETSKPLSEHMTWFGKGLSFSLLGQLGAHAMSHMKEMILTEQQQPGRAPGRDSTPQMQREQQALILWR